MMKFDNIKGNFGFGCMRFPMKDGEVDTKEVCKMVDAFIDAGFNYFDTAHGYLGGKSETALRECLTSRYPRASYILTNKLSNPHFEKESDIRPLFDEQLKACGVDYFDFYLMHAQNRTNFKKYKACRAYETAFELKKEGKVKHVGLSFHDTADILDMILTEQPQIEAVQLQINYLDWEDEGIESRKCFEVARKHNKPIMVMEAFKGGFLADVPAEAEKIMKDYNPDASVVSWALRFVAGLDDTCVILTGASSIDQMKENISEFKDFTPLNDEEYEIIKEVSEIINSNITVDCTKCRYCVDSCPEEIDIAKIFDFYNKEKLLGEQVWSPFGNAYVNYSKLPNVGLASDCSECGICIEECPQHINIPEVLKDVAKTFETEGYGF